MPESKLSLEADKDIAQRLDGSAPQNREERIQVLEEFVIAGGQHKVAKALAYHVGLSVDSDIVTEAVQDAMYRAYKYVLNGKYHYRDRPFSAFVRMIAWRCFLKNEVYRKRYVHFSEFETGDGIDQFETLQAKEELNRLEFKIALLQILPVSEKHCRILLARLFHGKQSAEIAQDEGMTDAAVRKLLSRLIQKLSETAYTP